MAAEIVQSLWIGNRLTSMEQLCICSFLRHGYRFHLYCYQPIDNVPAGTVVKPGEEILPHSAIFTYRSGRGKGNPSAFSNVFRYTLLHQRGGWWADLDMVCLRRLEFTAEHVFGCQRHPDREPTVAIGLVRAPAGSPLMQRCRERANVVDKEHARWGELGPGLTRKALRDVNVGAELLPPNVHYPVDYWEIERLIRPFDVPAECQAIHLWNSEWREAGIDPDGRFPADSLYERLRAEYLPAGWEQSLRPASLPARMVRWGKHWLRQPLRNLPNLFRRSEKSKGAA
jgi:hypothetical protein